MERTSPHIAASPARRTQESRRHPSLAWTPLLKLASEFPTIRGPSCEPQGRRDFALLSCEYCGVGANCSASRWKCACLHFICVARFAAPRPTRPPQPCGRTWPSGFPGHVTRFRPTSLRFSSVRSWFSTWCPVFSIFHKTCGTRGAGRYSLGQLPNGSLFCVFLVTCAGVTALAGSGQR